MVVYFGWRLAMLAPYLAGKTQFSRISSHKNQPVHFDPKGWVPQAGSPRLRPRVGPSGPRIPRVLSKVCHDRLLASWMDGNPFGHVNGLTVHHNPGIFLRAGLLACRSGVF